MDYTIIKIKTIHAEDNNGGLSFFEGCRDIPFEIKRVYYIHGVDEGTERGSHAHRVLNQFLFCPYGQIELILDDGQIKESVMLDNPSVGLYVSINIWRTIRWREKNSILCVAASDYYDEEEYIRDYDEFIKHINNIKVKNANTV